MPNHVNIYRCVNFELIGTVSPLVPSHTTSARYVPPNRKPGAMSATLFNMSTSTVGLLV
jgi:hypothetical protein